MKSSTDSEATLALMKSLWSKRQAPKPITGEETYEELLERVKTTVLRRTRFFQHWSIRAAAREVGVDPRMITYVLAGKKRSRPLVDKLMALPRRPLKARLDADGRLVMNEAWYGLKKESVVRSQLSGGKVG